MERKLLSIATTLNSVEKGDDILDEYSVCATPLNYNDNDCAVDIDIKTSLSGVTQHVCIYMHHTIKFHIWYQLNTFQ